MNKLLVLCFLMMDNSFSVIYCWQMWNPNSKAILYFWKHLTLMVSTGLMDVHVKINVDVKDFYLRSWSHRHWPVTVNNGGICVSVDCNTAHTSSETRQGPKGLALVLCIIKHTGKKSYVKPVPVKVPIITSFFFHYTFYITVTEDHHMVERQDQ